MTDSIEVLVTDLARLKMHHACNYRPNREVSWFGKAHVNEQGAVVMTDIHIPPQEVGGAHIEISTDDLAMFWNGLVVAGERVKDYPIWCHSHAGMGTGPSGVDTNTLKMLADQFGDWVIGIVTNNRGEFTAWAEVKRPWRTTITGIAVRPAVEEAGPAYDEVVKAMEHVNEKKVYTTTYSQHGKGSGWAGRQYPLATQTPKNGTSGEPTATAVGSRSAAERESNPVVNIRKSTLFPGHVEIMLRDRTLIVRQDIGQCEAWEKVGGASDLTARQQRKLEKAMDKAAKIEAKHRQAGTRDFAERPIGLIGTPDHIGFGCDGAPLKIGQEADLYFGIDGKPLFEGGDVGLNRALVKAGESGIIELDDGTLVDDGHVVSLDDLRSKYLLPAGVDDDDVVAFVASIHAGNNPFSPVGVA